MATKRAIVIIAFASIIGLVMFLKPSTSLIDAHHEMSISGQIIDNTTELQRQYLAERIGRRYTRVDDAVVEQIAAAAVKHQRDTFPRADDIVAIIAIESIFDPNAVSGLRTDPAKGLMQIRHGVWEDLVGGKDMRSIENQIKYGAEILEQYYERAGGNRDLAVMAYNLGITDVLRRGKKNERYLAKYHRELNAFRLPKELI